MPKKLKTALKWIFLAVAGAYGYWYFWVVTDTPKMFNEKVTLEQALERAAESDRLVLVVVTADFCPTCQAYKRGGLADKQVHAWAREHAETVYLEWERHPEVIASLGVQAFPATLVLRGDGSIIDSYYGPKSGAGLLAFLNRGEPL